MKNFVKFPIALAAVMTVSFCTSQSAVADTCKPLTLPEPLRLTSPIAADTIAMLVNEAESYYRSQQLRQAQLGFIAVLELEAGHNQSRLRLGNIEHKRGCVQEAMSQYRFMVPTIGQNLDDYQMRAAINLAILTNEQLNEQIKRLQSLRLSDELQAVVAELGVQRNDSPKIAEVKIAEVKSLATAPVPPAKAEILLPAAAALTERTLAPPTIKDHRRVSRGLASKSNPKQLPLRAEMENRVTASKSVSIAEEAAQSTMPVVHYIGGVGGGVGVSSLGAANEKPIKK